MSVAKGVPKYEGRMNVLDTMVLFGMKDGSWLAYRWYAVNFIARRYESSIGRMVRDLRN
jgi:hypothetical protein